MELAYWHELIDGGYKIMYGEVGGQGFPTITQPHSPNFGLNLRMSEDVAARIGSLVAEKMNRSLNAFVTPEEEVELTKGPVTPERFEEILQAAEVRELAEKETAEGNGEPSGELPV